MEGLKPPRSARSRPAARGPCAPRAQRPNRQSPSRQTQCPALQQLVDYSEVASTSAPGSRQGQLPGAFIERSVDDEERLRDVGAHCVVHALILAGGSAEPETNPLVRDTVVPALPIGGTHRLVDVAVGNLLSAGIKRMHVLTQVNSRELHRHITDLYPSRPLELTPSNLSFVEPLPCIQRPDRERPHLGSADALRSALGRVRYSQQGADKADDILVVSGQDLYHLDFRALVGFHREQGADVTMVTQRYHLGGSERMGLCKLSRDRTRVDRFVEKPSREELRRHVEGGTGAVDVSLGMYVFKRSVLESYLESDMERELGSIGDDVIAPAVASGMHVAAFEHSGRFTNCSRIGAYMDASLRFAAASSHPEELEFMHAIQPPKAAQVLPPMRMTDARLLDAMVSPGCFLDGNVWLSKCVVGPWTYIGESVHMANTLVHGHLKPQSKDEYDLERRTDGAARGIGRGSVLRRVIVGWDACIGEGVLLVNKEGVEYLDRSEDGFVVRDGVIVVLKGTVIPDGFTF